MQANDHILINKTFKLLMKQSNTILLLTLNKYIFLKMHVININMPISCQLPSPSFIFTFLQ